MTQKDKKNIFTFFSHSLFKKWNICDVLKNMILLLYSHILQDIEVMYFNRKKIPFFTYFISKMENLRCAEKYDPFATPPYSIP